MSMYEMVFPDPTRGERAAILLTVLGIPPGERLGFVGRFRDCWVEKQPDGPPLIAIYTRNGGNNRADQADAITAMQAHPCYLSDADDTFDRTYATFYFTTPTDRPDEMSPAAWEIVKGAIIEAATDPIDTDERWLGAIMAIGDSRG